MHSLWYLRIDFSASINVLYGVKILFADRLCYKKSAEESEKLNKDDV